MIKFYVFLVLCLAINLVNGSNVVFTLDDASNSGIIPGALDQEIVRLSVQHLGGGAPHDANVTSMNFTPDNTDDADIIAARLYYTTSTTFSTTNPMGSPDTDLSDGISFTFSQGIARGSTGYFWLAYDIANISCAGHLVDAQQVQADIAISEPVDSYTDNASGSRGILIAWSQKANFGGVARRSAAGFSIGTKGYIGTGDDGAEKVDFWEWDQSTNVWTQKADFGGTARRGAVGFSIGSKGYMGTGFAGGYTNDFWEWDQGSNVWIQKANFGGEARINAEGFSIGTKGYILTGVTSTTTKKDIWEWDQGTDVWVQKTDLSGSARYDATAFSIGNKGYVGLGYYIGAYLNDLWEWDQSTDSWSQMSDFKGTGRSRAVGFSINLKGYFGVGGDGVNYFSDFWEWDQASDKWTQRANFGGPVRNSGVGLEINGKGYVGTGDNPTYLQDFWEYDAALDNTAYISNVNTNVSCYGASDGSIDISVEGGPLPYTFNWSTGATTEDINNLTSGNYTITVTDNNSCKAKKIITMIQPEPWTQKSSFGGSARSYSAGFSIGNKGYIGTGEDGGTTKDFWEWDLTTNIWTQKADFGGVAREDAVGFSIGTKGYIGTGFNGTSTRYKDFWEWDQALNTWTQKTDFGGTSRNLATGFSIGTKGYVGTGYDGTIFTKDFWEWDQGSNTWTQKTDLGGVARSGATSFSIGTKGYIGTGYDGSSNLKDFWEWDQTSNSWVQKNDFGGTARIYAVGYSIGIKGYIGTGAGGGYKKDYWEWNQATDVWVQKADFGGVGRQASVGFALDSDLDGNADVGFIGVGYDGTYYTDFWQYDSSTECPTSQTFYWVGGIGTWNNAAKWSLTSGGAGGAGVPGVLDDALFDSNSGLSHQDPVTIPSGNFVVNKVSILINNPQPSFIGSGVLKALTQ